MFFLRNKKLFIIIGLILLVLLLLGVLRTTTNKNLTEPSTNFVPEDAPATLLNSGELYKLMDSVQFDEIRKYLNNYARSTKSISDQIIVYKLEGGISKQGEYVTFRVVYQKEPEHELTLQVELVSRGVVKISSAVDQAAPNNQDKLNDFIKTLPKETPDYTLEYDGGSRSFVVYLYRSSPEVREEIKSLIETSTGQTIDNLSVDYILSSSAISSDGDNVYDISPEETYEEIHEENF
jgi:hypothetical protein